MVTIMMQGRDLHDRLETWLRHADEHSEIPAAEEDWRRNLLKAAQQFEICHELLHSQSEKDLRDAVAMARTGNLESFELVRDLFQKVLLEMQSKGIV